MLSAANNHLSNKYICWVERGRKGPMSVKEWRRIPVPGARIPKPGWRDRCQHCGFPMVLTGSRGPGSGSDFTTPLLGDSKQITEIPWMPALLLLSFWLHHHLTWDWSASHTLSFLSSFHWALCINLSLVAPGINNDKSAEWTGLLPTFNPRQKFPGRFWNRWFVQVEKKAVMGEANRGSSMSSFPSWTPLSSVPLAKVWLTWKFD